MLRMLMYANVCCAGDLNTSKPSPEQAEKLAAYKQQQVLSLLALLVQKCKY